MLCFMRLWRASLTYIDESMPMGMCSPSKQDLLSKGIHAGRAKTLVHGNATWDASGVLPKEAIVEKAGYGVYRIKFLEDCKDLGLLQAFTLHHHGGIPCYGLKTTVLLLCTT